MSNTETFKLKAHALQSFFKDRKVVLKYNHCLEAVSQLETGLPWNTSKTLDVVKTPRIFQLNEVVVLSEIKQANNRIEVVIPMDLSTLTCGNIDTINDYISRNITGDEVSLEDIGYKVYPHFYDVYHVALLVSGEVNDFQNKVTTVDTPEHTTHATSMRINNPLTFHNSEHITSVTSVSIDMTSKSKKYTKKDMAELIHHIQKLEYLTFNDGTTYEVIWCCDSLDRLLNMRADSDIFEDMPYAFDFVKQSDGDYSKTYLEESVRYEDLYYATKNEDGSWTLPGETRSFKFM